MELIKSKKFLFGLVVVLLLVTSVLPGCNEELPVEADKLVIPSSLTPVEVFWEIAVINSYSDILPLLDDEWTAEYMEPYAMPQGATEEQFIEGYHAVVPEATYTKRDGERAGGGYYILAVDAIVLKYENPESAKRSFINISETNGLQNLTYEGIALKNGTWTLASWWEEFEEYDYWDNFTMPCHLIQSGCFVIHFYGREDIINDMLDRIIVAFGNDSANESDIELAKEIAQAEVAKGAEVTGGQPYCNLEGDVICYWFGVSKEGKASGSVVVGSSLYEHIIFQVGGGSPPSIPTADEVSSSVEKCLGLEVTQKDIGEPLRLVYITYSFYFAIYDIDGQLIAIDLVRKEAVPASELRMGIASPEQYRQYKEGK